MPPPDPPRRFITLTDLDRRVEYLEREFERRTGILGRDVGNLRSQLGEVIEANAPRAQMDSQTDLSIHPDRLRLTFRNVSPWAIVAVVAIVALVLVVVLR